MYLTCDGQELFPLDDNDLVVVRRSPRVLKLAKCRGDGYFARLRRKGFINRPCAPGKRPDPCRRSARKSG